MSFSKSAGFCKHPNNAAGEPFHYLLKVPSAQHLAVSVALLAWDQAERTSLFLPRTHPLYGCTTVCWCVLQWGTFGVCSSGCPGGLELSVLGVAVELLAYSCAALPSPAQHRWEEAGRGGGDRNLSCLSPSFSWHPYLLRMLNGCFLSSSLWCSGSPAKGPGLEGRLHHA